jgi:hypothetical protein
MSRTLARTVVLTPAIVAVAMLTAGLAFTMRANAAAEPVATVDLTEEASAALVRGTWRIQADHPELGTYYLYGGGGLTQALFCDNESNAARLWNDSSRSGYWKDAFHERVVNAREDAVNPNREGTKAGVWYSLQVPTGGREQIRLRLSKRASTTSFMDFDALFDARLREANSGVVLELRRHGNRKPLWMQ